MNHSTNNKVFLLIFLSTLAAFGPFVTDFYLPTLPEQTVDFHTSPALVQLGLSTTMWGLAVGQLAVGPLSDQKGRKGPLFCCLLLFTASTAAAAIATNIHLFLVMRFLEGLGAAGGVVMSRSVAADCYGGKELGSFMAVMGAIQGIAPISAPMIGSFIAEFAGWRGIFWLLFAIGAVLALVTRFRFVETLAVKPQPSDQPKAPRESLRESARQLAHDPVFCAIVLQQFIASAILFGHISSSPFIFRGHFNLSAQLYGVLFGVLAFCLAAGATVSSRFDPLKAISSGAYGMLLGSVLLSMAFLGELSFGWTIPCYIVLLFSLGLTLPSAMTAALTLHRSRAGFAAALLGSVSFVGGGLVAPLTSMGDARYAVSILFTVSSLLLTLLSFWLSRRLRIARGQELKL